MDPLAVTIISIFMICVAELFIWLLLCLIVTVVVAVVQLRNKKIRQLNPVRRTIKLAAYATIGFIMLIQLEIVYFTMYWAIRFSVWLLLCLSVTVITVVVQLINKKIHKRKPIHWAIKLAGYAVFYTISYFPIMNFFDFYPDNWLATDKEYRELAYELYHLTLECYEYRKISEGSHGEIVFYFRNDDKDILDLNLERTIKQRDHITIKNAVKEYIRMNDGFQGERIEIEFSEIAPYLCHAWTFTGHIYNFDPWTGETGTDASYWFVTDVVVNNCTELAELYHDFSGICASVGTLDDMQELANLCNLTYLELYVIDMDKEDQDLEDQYLDELNTLLPDCEIYLNQNKHIAPAWGNFAD